MIRDLDDAEQYQRMFVLPLVEAVREEVRPLVETVKQQEVRLTKVERNQGRALLGLAALGAILSSGFGMGVEWTKKHFRL